jgi:hypothetical protein
MPIAIDRSMFNKKLASVHVLAIAVLTLARSANSSYAQGAAPASSPSTLTATVSLLQAALEFPEAQLTFRVAPTWEAGIQLGGYVGDCKNCAKSLKRIFSGAEGRYYFSGTASRGWSVGARATVFFARPDIFVGGTIRYKRIAPSGFTYEFGTGVGVPITSSSVDSNADGFIDDGGARLLLATFLWTNANVGWSF